MIASQGNQNFENGHTKPKLLRFEVESRNCGPSGQGTVELNNAIV